MDRMKVIVKRPPSHYAIILIYILAPFMNILLVSTIGGVPLHLVFRNFFNGFGLFAGLWLITAPIVGLGFYIVNKFSWYLFIVHSLLIVIDFVFKWITRPLYFIKTVPGSQNAIMVTGNIILILIVGYVIQKNFRAPYFQALQRHWRESVRIPIHHVITVNTVKMNVNDLSATGCFIVCSDKELSLEQDHEIRFHSDRLEISCKGQIMRQTEDGYGLMFKELDSTQKKDIKHFLRKRFSLRQTISLNGQWMNQGISKDIQLIDISKGGCFSTCELGEIQEKDSGILVIEVDNKIHKIHGKITWINHKGEHQKPEGFGCAFNQNHKHLMKMILDKSGTSELTR